MPRDLKIDTKLGKNNNIKKKKYCKKLLKHYLKVYLQKKKKIQFLTSSRTNIVYFYLFIPDRILFFLNKDKGFLITLRNKSNFTVLSFI